MFRSLLCKSRGTLKRAAAIIHGESSSSTLAAPTAKYFFRIQNQNSRVTSTFSSFSTTASNYSNLTSCSDSSFVVSYLINSCGLSQTEAITASEKLSFRNTLNPDSVLALLKRYGFTEIHISKVISKVPSILQSNPTNILKPKLDFFKSKGIDEFELADFISSFPQLLTLDLRKEIIPCFDTLRSIVQSDENVVKMIRRNPWIISRDRVEVVRVNVEILRNEGVPETHISNHLILHPKAYTANRFEEIVDRVRDMGFHHSETTFLVAVHMLRITSEASLRNKMDIFKRYGGWSEDQILSAFRKSPTCMKTSGEKIMEVLGFLVIEMGYDSSIVAENPVIFTCNLEEKIIPRCSVIRVLISRGLIEENISLSTLATLSDESFLKKFVKKYEEEVPGLMKVFTVAEEQLQGANKKLNSKGFNWRLTM
ncbi:uncharacterized protein LOC113308575 isoform X1 [Papaver somniferum]|uniref:uncharacterized protein LOC113308575 isoform X1 n=1 Tax=Papaver somniferum TaxID=3469 RepID=UPI000E6FBBE3|nr:uncharacterized protein LOC113308575 isoform X1 [Papaver somniferum]